VKIKRYIESGENGEKRKRESEKMKIMKAKISACESNSNNRKQLMANGVKIAMKKAQNHGSSQPAINGEMAA
jgi:hypothetical protein